MYFMEWAEETKGLRKVILSAAVVLMPVSAWAMDCSKALTSTEKAICSSPELKKQDDQMNRDYRNFIHHYSKSGLHDCYIEDQKREQKDWVKKRDACGGDIGCIGFEYQNRLLLLSTLANACPGYDSDPAFKGRSCYEPSLPTAPVASTASPTAPTASTEKCPEGDRIDFNFVSKWEGGQALNAYVPGAYIRNKKKSGPVYVYLKAVKNPNISATSGVTVDTGLDLAYQSSTNLKNTLQSYVNKHGNPGNVDVSSLTQRLSPYMSSKLVGQTAFDKIVDNEPKISEAEADLLRDANAEQAYIPKAESNFNQHNQMGIRFKQLPAGIQTVLLDWTWQFGGADEIHQHSHGNSKAVVSRKQFWSLVYAGEWNQLANKLERADFARRGNGFDARYRARGEQIREAINGGWPDKGAAC